MHLYYKTITSLTPIWLPDKFHIVTAFQTTIVNVKQCHKTTSFSLFCLVTGSLNIKQDLYEWRSILHLQGKKQARFESFILSFHLTPNNNLLLISARRYKYLLFSFSFCI